MTTVAKMRATACLAVAGAVLSLASAGCGDGAPSVSASSEQATVHGHVTVKGKAVTKGTVSFNPANSARKSAPTVTADISSDGTYTVKTLIGGNTVTVRTPETAKNPKLSYYSKQVEVRSGDNEESFDVTPSR